MNLDRRLASDPLLRRVMWPATVVFLGVLPVILLVLLFTEASSDDAIAFDFRPFYAAAEAIVHGSNPYPGPTDPLDAASGPYVYPPLPALLTIPLTAVSFTAAGLILMGVLAATVPLTLWLAGVRDWRCYGMVFLWPPVISAIQTGNVTLLLVLASALAWRYRDRAGVTATAIGVSIAMKFLLWPLVVWQGATRRIRGAVLACAVGAAVLIASWGAIGFAGFAEYPGLLRRLEDTVGADSYTAYVVGLDVGLPGPAAFVVWLAIGLAALASVVVVGRGGDERTAFVLAILASLTLTPIVWLHYFAFLAVIVAVAQPRLGPVWFVPLAMVVTPGSGQPTPVETLATLAIAAVTFLLALRASRSTAVEQHVSRREAEQRPLHARAGILRADSQEAGT